MYEYALKLVQSTRPGQLEVPEVTRWIQWGSGPRGGQQLIMGAKARALLSGRYHATTEDVAFLAKPVLRHRIVCSFAAQAAGLTSDALIDRLLNFHKPLGKS